MNNLAELLESVKDLKNQGRFGLARKLLEQAMQNHETEMDEKLKVRVGQVYALCTYKDQGLPVSVRFERALSILDSVDNLQTSEDQETLGLAGAIYKRKWEVVGRKLDLEKSLSYYLRGYKAGYVEDLGYCGVNAAFVLDLLAFIEEKDNHDRQY